jgi:hypothetical protein
MKKLLLVTAILATMATTSFGMFEEKFNANPIKIETWDGVKEKFRGNIVKGEKYSTKSGIEVFRNSCFTSSDAMFEMYNCLVGGFEKSKKYKLMEYENNSDYKDVYAQSEDYGIIYTYCKFCVYSVVVPLKEIENANSFVDYLNYNGVDSDIVEAFKFAVGVAKYNRGN